MIYWLVDLAGQAGKASFCVVATINCVVTQEIWRITGGGPALLLPHPLSFSLLENVLLKSKSKFGNGISAFQVYLWFQVYVTRRDNWKTEFLMTTRMEVDRKCSSNPYFSILILRSGKMDFFSPPMCETCMVEVQVGQVQVFPETTSSRPKPNDGAHTPVNSPVHVPLCQGYRICIM